MPAVVSKSIAELLAELEAELGKHQPQALAQLQPGITDAELGHAEARLGAQIHPELRQLYQWHNGLAEGVELFPGYEFWSLETTIKANEDIRHAIKTAPGGRLIAHEASWLVLFTDAAGDGYHYDPALPYAKGGVFFVFRETGDHIAFPSIRNVLAAIIECYQRGVFASGETIDFDREREIMLKYGAEMP